MRSWSVLSFLFIFFAVNFADKAVFGLAAIPVMRDFGLSNAQFGAIGAAFFGLFSLSSFFVGRLGDRIDRKKLLAGLAVAWSAAQAVVLGPANAGSLLVSRLALGAGEGPAVSTAFPTAYAAVASDQRPLATAVLLAGAPLGTAAAALFCPPLILHFGWRAAYVCLGLVSLAWALTWIVAVRLWPPREVAGAAAANEARLPLRTLLGNRTMLGLLLASFSCYFLTSIAIVWYPKVLQEAAGLSSPATGRILAVAWALQVPLAFGVAAAVRVLTRAGRRRDFVYELFGKASVVLSGIAPIGIALSPNPWSITAFIMASVIVPVVFFTVSAPIVADISPAAQQGTALGAAAAFYGVAGAAGPFLFGIIVDRSPTPVGGYRQGFLIVGLAILIVALASAYLIRPERERRALQGSPL